MKTSNIKSIIIYQILIIFIFSLNIANAFEKSVDTCSSSEIQMAIDEVKAAGGGTVILPKCDSITNANFRVPAGVKIIGQGKNDTKLRDTIFSFNGESFGKVGDGISRLSNMSIINSMNEQNYYFYLRGCTGMRVDNVYIEGKYSTVIIALRNGYFLFDHNELNVFTGYGIYLHTDNAWADNIGSDDCRNLFGTDGHNAMFIEDCVFNGYLQHPIDARSGAHYVLRHCVFNLENIVTPEGEISPSGPIEGHGPTYPPPELPYHDPNNSAHVTDNNVGTNCMEIYDVEILQNGFSPSAGILFRSGCGVVYNTTVKNKDIGVSLGVEASPYSYPRSADDYPVYNQPSNIWIWNMTYENIGKTGVAPVWQSEECIQKDRDYFLREPNERLDGFKYTPYPYPHPLISGDTIDVTAPSSIDNLTVTNLSPNSIEVTWTAPGDDGDLEQASGYDIRVMTSSSITDENWDSATPISGEPSPSLPGTQENFTIEGLEPNTNYYIAIKTLDEAQNPSNLSNIANAQTLVQDAYYVAKNGNDNYDGSESNPWLTIQKATNSMVAGDTVYIKEGIYYEQITIQRSGTSGNFITYKSYPGHKPIIDGQNSGTILSIVGKEYIRVDGLEIKNAGQWGILVENSSNVEIKNTKVSYSNNGENIQIRGSSSFILIEGCEASYAQKWSGIDIYQYNGRPHHVTVKNCIAHHNENFAGIASEQADNLVIENNTCYNNSLGIDIGSGDNNLIRDNIVHDCATGIALSSNEDSQIYNNLIYNIVDEAIYSYYWIEHGEAHARNKWHNNIIYNAGFGIYESVRKNVNYDIGPSSDHEYYNNIFYNIGSHGSYRVPLYFQGTSGIKFYNNTIYMNANYDALQFIEDAKGAEIKNNIISISGDKFALRMEDTSYINAKVNFNFYENRNGTSIILWNDGTGVTNFTQTQVTDNTFYNNTGQGEYSIAGDPKFVEPLNDFHLQALSPCIDAGDPTYSVPSGGGLRIDIGAFEYRANNILAAPESFKIISVKK